MSQVEMLKVVNHNHETIRGRYDGVDYEFPTDEAITLPFAAAAHIFGIGNEDKRQALNMLGWLVPGRDSLEDALKKLDQVSFHEGRFTFEDEEMEETAAEEIADESQRRKRGGPRRAGSGGAPPSQVPGGEQAAAGQPSAAS